MQNLNCPLFAKKITVLTKYVDFIKVFSKKLAEVLPKQTGINKYAIEPEKNKQQFYRLIYSLGPVKLKTFKTYIKISLVNIFIRPWKSPAGNFIFFVCKRNTSLCFGVNYWGLNNFTIKNRYPLLFINEFLDWLKRAKCFTQLDVTSTYHPIKRKESSK